MIKVIFTTASIPDSNSEEKFNALLQSIAEKNLDKLLIALTPAEPDSSLDEETIYLSISKIDELITAINFAATEEITFNYLGIATLDGFFLNSEDKMAAIAYTRKLLAVLANDNIIITTFAPLLCLGDPVESNVIVFENLSEELAKITPAAEIDVPENSTKVLSYLKKQINTETLSILNMEQLPIKCDCLDCYISDGNIFDIINFINVNKQLAILNIENTPMSLAPENLAKLGLAIANSIELVSITNLGCHEYGIKSNNYNAFMRNILSPASAVTTLNVSYASDENLKKQENTPIGALINSLKNSHLKRLILSNCSMNDKDIMSLSLNLNNSLEVLEISQNKFSAVGINAFAKALSANTNLTEVDFGIVNLAKDNSEETLAALAKLIGENSCLKTVKLNGFNLPDNVDEISAEDENDTQAIEAAMDQVTLFLNHLAKGIGSNTTLNSLDMSEMKILSFSKAELKESNVKAEKIIALTAALENVAKVIEQSERSSLERWQLPSDWYSDVVRCAINTQRGRRFALAVERDALSNKRKIESIYTLGRYLTETFNNPSIVTHATPQDDASKRQKKNDKEEMQDYEDMEQSNASFN